MFLCSDFAKRGDKNILNLLSFILFFTKIIIETLKFNKVIKKRRNGKKTPFGVRKRKRHFLGNRYTKKRNIESQNEQEATSSSSHANKLQDSLNYSTSIVDELDQDEFFFLKF